MKKSGAILNKRQLVDQILSQMNVSETIERISREDNRFPLSFAQKDCGFNSRLTQPVRLII